MSQGPTGRPRTTGTSARPSTSRAPGARPTSSRPSAPRSTAPGDRRHRRPSQEVLYRRRRLAVAALALVAVVVVVLLAAFAWPGFARPAAEPAPTVTVTAPAPTPTVEPAERPEGSTAFAAALPDRVLQFAWRGQEESAATLDADAVEGWTVTYADGDGEGATTVVVTAGQWGTPEQAAAVEERMLTAAGEASSSGDVVVGGETVGTWAVTPSAEAGRSVVTWRNGTAVLQATGPTDVVEDFYAAFPL